ncbi:GerAB/ArcD/ProY family transporter [Cohnella sp. AR92]|uniref:GerAB/ArcD/ProY family transporter n=1 Tax=Cohnella sp. AR92 TaxID=648716 RepID=UPI000F8DA7D5|nr:GerAB/ArcD/ProY family transporter [Cohnella sp. AR92]RUS46936.1 spore gernimation protein [Cohnella sp. AR92]
MRREQSITARQLFALVLMTQLGTEVLSLPHVESGIAAQDSWLAVLLSGLAGQLGILVLWRLGSRYPERNYFSYTASIVGIPAKSLINLLYGSYYVFSGLLLGLQYSDILNRWLFIYTPRWIILLLILIVCGFAATASLRQLANVVQTFILFPILGFLLILFSGVYGYDATNLLPVLSNGWSPVLRGAYAAFSAYVGYEVLLYAYPYVDGKGGAPRILLTMTLANGCTTAFYVIVCLICSTMFSTRQLNVIPEPIVFILKNYRVQVLQSIDTLFLIFYLSVVTATLIVYYFLAAKAYMNLRNQGLGRQGAWVWGSVAICFVFGLFIRKRGLILEIASIQDRMSVFFVVAVPFLLLIVAGIRRYGGIKS